MIEYGEGNGVTTALNPVEKVNLCKVYSDRSHIIIANLLPESKLYVYGISGQLIWQTNQSSSDRVQISVRTGFYVVKIFKDGKIQSEKVAVP